MTTVVWVGQGALHALLAPLLGQCSKPSTPMAWQYNKTNEMLYNKTMNKSGMPKPAARNYTNAVKSAMTGRFVVKGRSTTPSTSAVPKPNSLRTTQILETRASRLRSRNV